MQVAMSVCEEWEDVVSMSLTAVANLLRKFKVSPSEVGRSATAVHCPSSAVLLSLLLFTAFAPY